MPVCRLLIVAGMTLFTIAVMAPVAEAQPLDGTALREAMQGCWEHRRFGTLDRETGKEPLLNSMLACLNREGIITGVTFDDGDGWEWMHRYSVKDRRVIVSGEVWWTVEDVGDGKLIVVRPTGERRTFDHVCRTAEEDVQCERLQYKIEP
jgi:hypothetical protein